MTTDDCLPVHVALQLMDHSSLGRGGDYQDFQKTSRQLQKALKAIVNGMPTTDTPVYTILNTSRTSSGVQQLYWYISQDPVWHPGVTEPCTSTERVHR